MTVSDILSDERLRQDEFPVCRSKAYLAHAGVAPLARCAADAIGHYSFMAAQDDQETWLPKLHRAARESATKLLVGAQPDEIAFIGPTSLALSMVAGGLTFRRSDNIVVYHDDFPSNVYPWMALAAHGVKVRYLNTRELGRIRTVDVLGQVDESTRLVALGAAHFISGWRIDLDAIGKALRQRGILFCVDAMQTLGAFPLSVANVDFLAADGHIRQDPAELLESPKRWQTLPKYLRPDEVDRLLAQADPSTPEGLRDKAMLELLYATGLRVSELVSLRRENVREGWVEVRSGDSV
mgnify:CR=1 FL=1